MTLTTFTKLIETFEAQSLKKHEAYKIGIDLLNFDEEYYGGVIQPLLVEVFGPEGLDWVEWYLYERDLITGKLAKAWDEHGNEICHNIPSLYQTVTALSVGKRKKKTHKQSKKRRKPAAR